MRSEYKKETKEDKFDRKYWGSQKAKQSWLRWTKRTNNRKIRRKKKRDTINEANDL